MTQSSAPPALETEALGLDASGQPSASLGLRLRRVTIAVLSLGVLGVIGWWAARLLGGAVWTPIDVVLFVCVMASAPWTILSFWNAVIGLALSRLHPDPEVAVSPFLADADAEDPITERVAVLMTLRNEDPDRAFARLQAMRVSLEATGDGRWFDVFVLSDSSEPEICAREEALFAAHEAALAGAGRAVYRRRSDNAGFKAGNVRDFLERWGDAYTFMIPLDADSVMSGAAMARMTRIAQRHPRIGILQSIALGAPSDSPFARLFQFGMRQSQRLLALGSAWWQAECGPYWGHNAVVRVRPFKAHCRLPRLPGKPPLGGEILSHDQVEAALMRRAGYEVRVIPRELESWEELPVTALDFIKREQRWCNGNLQYGPLLATPGLHPISRFQLAQAMLMYLAAPAWMLMTAFGALKLWEAPLYPDDTFDTSLALMVFFAMLGMSLAPKIAGALETAFRPGGVAAYGGPARFIGTTLVETAFSALLAPIVALRMTVFIAGLALGRNIGWSGQVRDAYGLAWTTAFRGLWAQTLAGAALIASILATAPFVLPWAAPVAFGLLFAAPIAVATASTRLGAWMRRRRIAVVPEEVVGAPMLAALDVTPDRVAEALAETLPQPRRPLAAAE